jgi:DNA-binding winged helix-turn-helix (wHTH) protein
LLGGSIYRRRNSFKNNPGLRGKNAIRTESKETRVDMASPAAKPASRHRFGDLTLDPGRRCVWRGGEQIRLSSLTFELLRVLVEHAPNVVAHDALVDRTWGPHRIVTPENLAKRVMLLRQALGDDADKPRYVERVRSQGYRLIPDVVDATRQEAAVSPAEPQVAAELSRRVARGARAFGRAALATGVLLLMASAGWLAGERLPSREAVADVRSIAVLPFENRSVAEEDAGLPRSATSRLPRARQSWATARNRAAGDASARSSASEWSSTAACSERETRCA